MRLWTFRTFLLFAFVLAATESAFAQGSIAGVVKDESGAVLPGVSVEASSPALIEKVRTVVTDATGQYQITDLRPGVYSVKFTLSGFNVVKRDGVELSGTFTANVNASLKVGGLAETIVVTGETPIVDIHSAVREQNLNKDVVDSIPTSRLFMTVGVLVPGMNISGAGASNGSQDVGGLLGDTMADLTINGSRATDERLNIDGMSIGHPERGGSQASGLTPNMGSVQEVSVAYSGGLGEAPTGGVLVNLIPREGGNKFTGTVFANFSTSSLQSKNATPELLARGLGTPNEMKRTWDINPSAGGPIMRDKLWFYTSFRDLKADNYPAGIFPNVNASNVASWTYVPDTTYATSPRPVDDQYWRSMNLRLTWQVSEKNKVSVFADDQGRCRCHAGLGALRSPEATTNTVFGGNSGSNRLWQGTWSSPLTSKLLLEAGATTAPLRDWGPKELLDRDPALYASMIPASELSIGLNYRSNNLAHNTDETFNYRGSVSYVTGAHKFKLGYTDEWSRRIPLAYTPNLANLSYRFVNGLVPNPVPNQFTMQITPVTSITEFRTHSLYAQDSWTINHFTFGGGLRYDHFTTFFPTAQLGPSKFIPNAIVYPDSEGVNFKDITPRGSAVWDVFKNGKTAVRASIGRYVTAQDGGSTFGSLLNPITRTVTTTTRTWTDTNQNYIPDCNLLNPAANLECGPMANQSFALLASGQAAPFSTNYDPSTLSGWGNRLYNWEFAAGVQQQLTPTISASLTYTRRWYGNFSVTQNLGNSPADWAPYSITVPSNPALPGGGGYVISDLYDVSVAKFPIVNNLVRNASDFGRQLEHYNGISIDMTARPRGGLLLSGGTSIGGTMTDNCDLVVKVNNPSARACNVPAVYMPNIKALGSYTIRKVDVLVSATFQSIPGFEILANWNVPSAVIKPSLGRDLSSGANSTTIVNVIDRNTLFGDRLNQLDLRLGKILRFSGKRATVSVDLYNALNSNVVTSLNNTFNPADATVWQRPNSILAARFIKFGVQFDL